MVFVQYVDLCGTRYSLSGQLDKKEDYLTVCDTYWLHSYKLVTQN